MSWLRTYIPLREKMTMREKKEATMIGVPDVLGLPGTILVFNCLTILVFQESLNVSVFHL